jgi:DNA replication protein DnaC
MPRGDAHCARNPRVQTRYVLDVNRTDPFGPTGARKTWVACAFAQQACRQGFSVLYVRVARLFEELKIAHDDGSFNRRLAQLAKMDVLLLDDWGLRDLDQGARNDLLEVLDDCVGTRSTITISQILRVRLRKIWCTKPLTR